jgi:hypothetical protein
MINMKFGANLGPISEGEKIIPPALFLYAVMFNCFQIVMDERKSIFLRNRGWRGKRVGPSLWHNKFSCRKCMVKDQGLF